MFNSKDAYGNTKVVIGSYFEPIEENDTVIYWYDMPMNSQVIYYDDRYTNGGHVAQIERNTMLRYGSNDKQLVKILKKFAKDNNLIALKYA